MRTRHIHAENMALYAEDALTTACPWERWEYRYSYSDDDLWKQLCYFDPLWCEDREYRRKPKTIIINGFEVPEPMRVRPAVGDAYYYPHLLSGGVRTYPWIGDEIDQRAFKSGQCHLTKEAAELHLSALLSFTALEDLS